MLYILIVHVCCTYIHMYIRTLLCTNADGHVADDVVFKKESKADGKKKKKNNLKNEYKVLLLEKSIV